MECELTYPECSCEIICKFCKDWEEHDSQKYNQEMKELDNAVKEGTDIYPDTFY